MFSEGQVKERRFRLVRERIKEGIDLKKVA